MNSPKYTKQQEEAIKLHDNNILVSAGAGAGKTQIIVARIIHFITHYQYQLTDFLIVTFTKLAACELKQRIRNELTKLELFDQLKYLETCQICTIDSFTFWLVKKYHIQLGLDQDLNILDNIYSKILVEKQLDQIVDDLYKQKNQILFDFLNAFCLENDQEFRKLVLSLYNQAIKHSEPLKFLNGFISKIDYRNAYDFSDKYLHNNLSLLLEKMQELDNQDAVRNLVDQISCLTSQTYEEIVAFFKQYKRLPRYKGDDQEKWIAFKDEFNKFKSDLKFFADNYENLNAYFNQNKNWLQLISDVTTQLITTIDHYKQKHNYYEFHDIFNLAYRLLKENNDVCHSLKKQFKMIIIDEYQDTDSKQEDLFNLFANKNLYLVGDIKQSIYRFRNADVTLFLEKYNSYKNNKNGCLVSLNDNFRSRKETIEGINVIFDRLMTIDSIGIDYQQQHQLIYGNHQFDIYDQQQNYRIQFLLYNKDSKNQDIKIVASDILNKIKNKYQVLDKNGHLRSCQYSDFCILSPRGTNFDKFYELFKKLNIPLNIQHEQNIVHDNLIYVLINLSKLVFFLLNKTKHELLNDKEFIHCFVSLARSFIYQYSDQQIYEIVQKNIFFEDQIISSLLNIITPIQWETFSYIFKTVVNKIQLPIKITANWDAIDRQEKIIEKYYQLLQENDDLDNDYQNFFDWMKLIQNKKEFKFGIKDIRPNTNSVNLMTIHGSKGLQFKIVYLVELETDLVNKNKTSTDSYSGLWGLVLPEPLDKQLLNYTKMVKLTNKYFNYQDEWKEKLRWLYVALTRASEKIYLICSTTKEITNNQYGIVDLQNDRSDPQLDLFLSCKKYKDLLSFFLPIGNYKYCDIDLVPLEKKEIKKQEIIIKQSVSDFKLNSSSCHKKRPSHQLDQHVDVNNLEWGIKMHKQMQILHLDDLKNNLPNKELQTLQKCPIFQWDKVQKFYHEYEFFDEENNISGSIDAIVVYADHIDVIDYKTKNIDFAPYIDQVKIYVNYIKRLFKKPTFGYLYSLMNGDYKKV